MRKGVTLIELLIVITIIAVLAGAAIPYVQDYLDQSRFARAKADLDEIKAAISRYEVDRGDYPTGVGVASLVGPYLSKALVDPWGAPYVVDTVRSTVVSYGPDGATGTDDIIDNYRPPLAVSQVYWIDTNGDGQVGISSPNQDSLQIRLTRPGGALAANAFWLKNTSVGAGGTYVDSTNRIASVAVPVVFVPGKDNLSITATSSLLDLNSTRCRQDVLPVKAR